MPVSARPVSTKRTATLPLHVRTTVVLISQIALIKRARKTKATRKTTTLKPQTTEVIIVIKKEMTTTTTTTTTTAAKTTLLIMQWTPISTHSSKRLENALQRDLRMNLNYVSDRGIIPYGRELNSVHLRNGISIH